MGDSRGHTTWPSLPYNFKDNKSREILIQTIFVILGNYQGQFDKVVQQWNNSKFRFTGLNICNTYMYVINGGLFPKAWSAAFQLRSHSKQSAMAPNYMTKLNHVILYRYWPGRSWNITFRWTAKRVIFFQGIVFSPKCAALRENLSRGKI